MLSRGLLSGSRSVGPQDFRAHLPRFTGANLARNEKLVAALTQVASSLGASGSQVAMAWAAARGRRLGLDLVPLVGARTLAQLEEALGALSLSLGAADLERIEAAMPQDAVAGTRYDAFQMSHLDSEK